MSKRSQECEASGTPRSKSEEVKTKSEADVLRTRIASLITDPGGDDPQRAHGHETEGLKKLSVVAEESAPAGNEGNAPPPGTYEFCSSRRVSLDESVDSSYGRRAGGKKRGSRPGNENTAGRWNKEEHAKFIQGLKLYGRDWKKVEGFLRTRTGAQIRSHAQKFFNRITREFGAEDPAQFVTSGQFERRLAQGYIPQSAQESTFLYCPPSFNQSSYPSVHSPRNTPSTFAKPRAEEPTPHFPETRHQRKLKREATTQRKSEKSLQRSHTRSEVVNILSDLRPRYEGMIVAKASLVTSLHYNQDPVKGYEDVHAFLVEVQGLYDQKIYPAAQDCELPQGRCE